MRCLCLFFLLVSISLKAQQADLSARIASQELSAYNYNEHNSRKVIHFKNRLAYFNPLAYIGGGLMFFYQNVLSEQIQASCMYETSCSEYTKLSIQRYGMLRGTLRGLNQFSECHGGALDEHPAIMISTESKVRNSLEKSH